MAVSVWRLELNCAFREGGAITIEEVAGVVEDHLVDGGREVVDEALSAGGDGAIGRDVDDVEIPEEIWGTEDFEAKEGHKCFWGSRPGRWL